MLHKNKNPKLSEKNSTLTHIANHSACLQNRNTPPPRTTTTNKGNNRERERTYTLSSIKLELCSNSCKYTLCSSFAVLRSCVSLTLFLRISRIERIQLIDVPSAIFLSIAYLLFEVKFLTSFQSNVNRSFHLYFSASSIQFLCFNLNASINYRVNSNKKR